MSLLYYFSATAWMNAQYYLRVNPKYKDVKQLENLGKNTELFTLLNFTKTLLYTNFTVSLHNSIFT